MNLFKAPPNSCVSCAGIKGTGMSAPAELLLNAGVTVTGADTGDFSIFEPFQTSYLCLSLSTGRRVDSGE
jgi:hypothetical protein